MIELLYINRDSSYVASFIDDIDQNRHGDIILNATSATANMEYAGNYDLTVSCPLDEYIKDGKKVFDYGSIVVTNVIRSVYPTITGDKYKTGRRQIFSIYSIEVNDREVTFHAEPILYRLLRQKYAIDVRPENVGTAGAVWYLNENCFGKVPYPVDISGSGNKSTTAYYQNMTMLEALNGNQDNSMVNRWQTLIIPSNNVCCFCPIDTAEQYNEVGWTFVYGKDLTGLRIQYDGSAVAKWVRPVGYNGRAMSIGYTNTRVENGGVWSPTMDKNDDRILLSPKKEIVFDNIRLREDIQSGDDLTGLTICENQAQLDLALYNATNNMFEIKKIDTPTVTIDISVADIAKNTELSPKIQELFSQEKFLGDGVRVMSWVHGVDVETRIIGVEYNCLNDKIEKLTLSNSDYNFFKLLNYTVNTSSNIYSGRL